MGKVHEIITQQILDKLEAGIIPWKKPFNCPYPQNLISKKEYKGINLLLLSLTSEFSSPYWLTFKQAKSLGGRVLKGQKSKIVIFYTDSFQSKKDKDTNDDEEKSNTYKVLRYYRVFNSQQIDLPKNKIPKLTADNKLEPISLADSIIKNFRDKPTIKIGSHPYYQPELDYVAMPDKNQFNSQPEYYQTLFHELAHSTGHHSRLNRFGANNVRYASEAYSKEELVAELTASFLSQRVGIVSETIDNSASYISSWLRQLKNDPKMIIRASGKAQKASDYIQNINGR
jgi:antirestriction protein ArdC